MAWCGVVWCSAVWCGVVWWGVEWWKVVWCGVALCGVALRCAVCYGVAWYGTAHHRLSLPCRVEPIYHMIPLRPRYWILASAQPLLTRWVQLGKVHLSFGRVASRLRQQDSLIWI